MVLASKKFVAACVQQCKWLPCPGSVSSSEDGSQFEELPAVLAGWSEDAKQHVFGVADVQLQMETGTIQDCKYKQAFVQPHSITDVQVGRWVDQEAYENYFAVSSNSSGSLSLVLLQTPADLPGATTADLQVVDPSGRGDDAGLGDSQLVVSTQQLHQAPAASVDYNAARQLLLSVAGDGSICIVPMVQFTQAAGATHTFKQASGWSGYSQGRWADSHVFVTTGVLGGLQVWDERLGPSPVSRSKNSWGHTGCGLMDKQMSAQRQLLCLDIHPSRPNLAATGAPGGTVAIWDLRFQSAPLALTGSRPATGDVCQCKFDLHSPQSTAAVPPVYYCTLDGAFCAAQDAAAAAAAEAAMQGSSWAEASSGSGGLVAEVLHQESCAICSFDVEPAYGRSILAATADEHLLLLQMEDSQMQQM